MENKKVLLDVDNLFPNSVGIIVLAKTGVWYTNQSDGIGCSHPEAEGYLLRYCELNDFVFDDCSYGCHHISRDTELQEKLAEGIDKYFKSANWPNINLKFDYWRISQTMENWIPVIVNYKGDIYNEVTLNNAPGILTGMGNCD